MASSQVAVSSNFVTNFQFYYTVVKNTLKKPYFLKGLQIGKETVKISLFVDDMILYLKD
jgi:hypothetical protein